MLLSLPVTVPAAAAYPGLALHLLRLLGFAAAAHRLTHQAGPLPLAAPAQLSLLLRQAGLYAELFEPDAPTDTEETLLVLALLPTLRTLAADAARLPGASAQRLAAGLRHSTAALQARHGISEDELTAWATCLDSGPYPEPGTRVRAAA